MIVDELEKLEQTLSRDAPSTNYVQGLRRLREETPREVLEICRAWHGPWFAWPGRRAGDREGNNSSLDPAHTQRSSGTEQE